MALLRRYPLDDEEEERGWEGWEFYPCDGEDNILNSTFHGRPMAWEERILEDCDHRGVFYNEGVLKRLLIDEDSGMMVVTNHLMRSAGFGGERTKAASVAFYEPI